MTTNPITVVDVSDVSKAITALLNQTIFGSFPNPAVLTSATLNGTVVPIRIFRGWPSDDRLQTDVVKTSGVNISIYTLPVTRNTTRFQLTPDAVIKAPLTATLTVSGASVTVTGTGSAANLIGAAYGTVAGSYRPTDGESATSMATHLAATIPGATVAGAVITLPTNLTILARTVGDVSSFTETARQAQRFLISIWAPSTTLRDLVGGIVHGAMSRTAYLVLPYGAITQPLIHRGMSEPQMDEKVGIFRRDETYEIEFPTIDMVVNPAIMFLKPNINGILTPVE